MKQKPKLSLKRKKISIKPKRKNSKQSSTDKNMNYVNDVTCCGPEGEDITDFEKIIIVGNPNVGKSMIFNQLTGSYVVVSNYPGTTVTIDTGSCKIKGKKFGVIDSPGLYSLKTITEEERIAKEMLFKERAGIVLHVVDAKNLSRMLPMTLQLIEARLPLILVINMMDEAERLGIKIDISSLSSTLGIPVIPVTATTGQGINELKNTIATFRPTYKKLRIYRSNIESAVNKISIKLSGKYRVSERILALLLLQEDRETLSMIKDTEPEKLKQINKILKQTQKKFSHPLNYIIQLDLKAKIEEIVIANVHQTKTKKLDMREKISRLMIRPITGIPILIVVLYFGIYMFVGVFGAGVLVDLIEGTLFGQYINPYLTDAIQTHIPYTEVQDLLVGEYGIFTLGITYSIAIIFPIVGTFFFVFAIIEDSGYLPRLALLIDRVFKRIGLSGRAVIPLVLGLGCDTMATVVTRTQETKRERIIATLLLALAIPCSAQLGVIFGILSSNVGALIIWGSVVLMVFLFIGYLSSKVLPGAPPSFYMELPPLRLPKLSHVAKKTYSRMVWYFKEIFPIFILTSIIIWFLNLIGAFQLIINGFKPIVGLLGLPGDASPIFILGFFRRDYGAAGLYDMQGSLSMVQLTVAAVTLTLFVPCIAQLLIMIKERGSKTAILIFLFVLFMAFFVGFLLNFILTQLGVTL
jgi:ferrous iron transport protein B